MGIGWMSLTVGYMTYDSKCLNVGLTFFQPTREFSDCMPKSFEPFWHSSPSQWNLETSGWCSKKMNWIRIRKWKRAQTNGHRCSMETLWRQLLHISSKSNRGDFNFQVTDSHGEEMCSAKFCCKAGIGEAKIPRGYTQNNIYSFFISRLSMLCCSLI
jgi:hypothetical protein